MADESKLILFYEKYILRKYVNVSEGKHWRRGAAGTKKHARKSIMIH